MFEWERSQPGLAAVYPLCSLSVLDRLNSVCPAGQSATELITNAFPFPAVRFVP